MSSFAVFGNPIKHSKSAEIYALFAKECGMITEYDLRLVSNKTDVFDHVLYDFFRSKGLGANITTPFKERAFFLCNQLTERAKIARSVNTIKKVDNKFLLGDNTDGVGFISDLKRLGWINNDDIVVEKKMKLSSSINVLLIGAGGAAKGVIPVLLTIPGCNLEIVNRTLLHAQQLVQYFQKKGFNNVSLLSLDALYYNTSKNYHLIVNATTTSVYDEIPKLPSFIIAPFTKCYDFFYKEIDTSFIKWCKQNGSNYCSDGLGMLVGQAAYSFYLWHGFFPSIIPVLNHLRSMYSIE